MQRSNIAEYSISCSGGGKPSRFFRSAFRRLRKHSVQRPDGPGAPVREINPEI